MTLNPFRAYLAYRERQAAIAAAQREAERQERREDRAAFMTAIQSMTAMTAQAFEVSRAQAEVIKSFMDGFKITETPQIRQYDEDADLKRWMEQHGVVNEEALAKQMGEYKFMLDTLDNL